MRVKFHHKYVTFAWLFSSGVVGLNTENGKINFAIIHILSSYCQDIIGFMEFNVLNDSSTEIKISPQIYDFHLNVVFLSRTVVLNTENG